MSPILTVSDESVTPAISQTSVESVSRVANASPSFFVTQLLSPRTGTRIQAPPPETKIKRFFQPETDLSGLLLEAMGKAEEVAGTNKITFYGCYDDDVDDDVVDDVDNYVDTQRKRISDDVTHEGGSLTVSPVSVICYPS